MPDNKGHMGKVDINQALDLKYNRHLSYKQIAAVQGVSPQGVHNAIKGLLPIPETQVYIDHRADILANIQLKLLSELDDDRLKKAPVGSLVLAACQLYDKEQLERGHGADARPLVVIQINTAVDKAVDNSNHNNINTIEVK